MAKKKAEKAEKTVSSIEDKITSDFGDILVPGNYITDSPNIIVSVSPQLDIPLGGGIKFGSFVIPTGPPKVGKTSTSLDFASSAVQAPTEFDEPRSIYFFNIEGRLNKRDLLGIRAYKKMIDDGTFEKRVKIITSKPGRILNAEDYLAIGEELINEKPGSIFIFDSFSQLCSKAGKENEWDKQFRDDVPKMLSQFCKRVSNVIPINKSIVIGITHRIANTGFGFSSWAEASGTKIQYQVDVKLRATHNTDYKVGTSKVGLDVNWECLCSPLLNGASEDKCVSKLRFGYGIDKPAELVNLCVDIGLIKKAGAWYSFAEDENKKYQGLENIRDVIAADEVLYKKLHDSFREMMGLPDAYSY